MENKKYGKETVRALENLRDDLCLVASNYAPLGERERSGKVDGKTAAEWKGAKHDALLEFAVSFWQDGFTDYADDLRVSVDLYARAYFAVEAADLGI